MTPRDRRRYRSASAAGMMGAILLLSGCGAPTVVPTPSAVPASAASPVRPSPAPSPAVVLASPSAAPSPSVVPLSGTVRIVSSLPRTGSAKGLTDSMVNSIRMALADAGGRVGGATVTYEDLDDAIAARGNWDAQKEADNARKAIADRDVLAYIGTLNSRAAAISIPLLCQAGMAMVSPANTRPGLTKKIDGVEEGEPDKYYPGCARNYARVVPTNELQGGAAAAWAKQLGSSKAYILDDADPDGHAIALHFREVAGKVALQVVGGPEAIDPKASEYRAQAQKIRAAGADVVFFGGITQNNAGRLWQDLRAVLGPDVRLMGADGLYEQAFLDAAGRSAEGTYVLFFGVPPNKLTGKGADWYRRYVQTFQSEPETYAPYAYEATRVALDAIQRAGTRDRARVRQALLATRDFDGVLGRWSLTATGDTTLGTMSGRRVKDSRFDEGNVVLLDPPR